MKLLLKMLSTICITLGIMVDITGVIEQLFWIMIVGVVILVIGIIGLVNSNV